MSMSPEEQIEKLRKSARLSWIPKGLFALTLVLIALGLQSGYGVFFVVGAFTGLASVASKEAAPHWRNAIKAIQTGTRSTGNMSIAITRDPTSFDDYVATVRDESQSTWQFKFSPQYWEPVEGDYKVEIYYVCGVEWPVLLLTESGLLFPAFTPERIIEKP